VGEACNRYSALLGNENELFADLLVEPTDAGIWAMFSASAKCEGARSGTNDLTNTSSTASWLWMYINDRLNMGICGSTPAMKLKMSAQVRRQSPVKNGRITECGSLARYSAAS
jgi:hypothetical protein